MEFLGNILLLIVGGNDTTRNSITGGLIALDENPDQRERAMSEPAVLPHERAGDALVDVAGLVGEAAAVAEPAVVDLDVVAGEHPHAPRPVEG